MNLILRLSLATFFTVLIDGSTIGSAHADDVFPSPESLPEEQSATKDETPPAKAGTLEETIVHARRRAELLEETPVSLTVLTGELLRVTGTERLDEIQGLVPNLSIFTTGDNQSASIVIRGVGNFPLIYFDQGVGLYVDGVYLARSAGSILDIVDVDQIEVLRGPQGTLFGKNTVGGAVNVTTVRPQPRLEASGMLRGGSYGTLDSRVTLNAPIRIGGLQDELTARVTFASFQEAGYTYNTFRREYQSDQDSLNFLGTVQYAPNDDLVLRVTGTWGDNHAHGLGGRCIYVRTPPPFVPVPPGYQQACDASSAYRFNSDTHRIASMESAGTWGILEWALPRPDVLDRLALKLTSSWRQQTPRVRDDGDMTEYFVAQVSGTGGSGVFDGQPGYQRQIQQELQIEGVGFDDRLAFVGGFFGYWEKADTENGVIIAPYTPFESLGTNLRSTSIDNWDWAPFLQGTAKLMSHLSLTAGFRFTSEKKELSRLVQRPLEQDPNRRIALDFNGRKEFSAWTPMVTLATTAPDEWVKPASIDSLMGYFTYSQGFRGGGFNGGVSSPDPALLQPFSPEYVDSFEIGFKTLAFANRASLNVSFFLANRSDQQVSQALSQGVLPVTVTTNAASSTSKGFEIEMQANPVLGLAMVGSVGYLDAYYDQFDLAINADTGASTDRSGQQLPFVPRWQTHVGIQYAMEGPPLNPTWLRGIFTPRIDWSWQSQVINWGPEVKDLVQSSYSLLNARLGYMFDDGHSELAFWAKNLANVEYFRDSLAQAFAFGTVIRYYEPPRTFGGEFTYRF